MCTRAVFLDKDGTLIENVPYNVDPGLIELAPGAAQALPRHAAGYRLIVISNQSGVARGYFEEDALSAVERLREILAELGVPLSGFYYCPHHPEGDVPRYAVECTCRKPFPGMIFRAAEELGVDPSRSWFIGDLLDDVEAGRLAGCETILIDSGHVAAGPVLPNRTPHHVVDDLLQAAILVTSDAEAAS